MRFTYKREADSLSIELGGGRTIDTVYIRPGISADLDREGRLVCIEVLAASSLYPRAQLEKLSSPIELITIREAARDCGLDPSTIRRHVVAGRIPGARKDGADWLLPRHELWRYLEARAPAGRARRARARPATVW